MKLPSTLRRIFLVSAIAIGTTAAMGDDSQLSRSLIHPDFNHLVPTNYPLKTTGFNRLKPRSYPVIRPGTPTVHITEKVVQTNAQPLLRTN